MIPAVLLLHTATFLYVPSRVIPSYGDLLVCSEPAHSFIRRPCMFRARSFLQTVTFMYVPSRVIPSYATFMYVPSRVIPSYGDLHVCSEPGHSFIRRPSCMFRTGSFLHTATFLYVPTRLIPSYGDFLVYSEPVYSFIRDFFVCSEPDYSFVPSHCLFFGRFKMHHIAIPIGALSWIISSVLTMSFLGVHA